MQVVGWEMRCTTREASRCRETGCHGLEIRLEGVFGLLSWIEHHTVTADEGTGETVHGDSDIRLSAFRPKVASYSGRKRRSLVQLNEDGFKMSMRHCRNRH